MGYERMVEWRRERGGEVEEKGDERRRMGNELLKERDGMGCK